MYRAGLSTFENGNEGDLLHRKMPMREIYRSVIFRQVEVCYRGPVDHNFNFNVHRLIVVLG